MLGNYVRVALRQLKKSPAFTAINVIGLSLALSVCLLIVTVMTEQHALDRFHPQAENIVRFTTTLTASHGTYPMATSASMLGPEMARQSPNVERYVRLRKAGGQLMRDDGVTTRFRGLYAEEAFFDVFRFPLAKGSDRTALTEPHSVVLGDELARSLFGEVDPLGKTLRLGGTDVYTVTGVLEPTRRRSHLRFEALLSMATIPALAGEGGAWDDFSLYYNYLVLSEGADPAHVEDLAARVANLDAVKDAELRRYGIDWHQEHPYPGPFSMIRYERDLQIFGISCGFSGCFPS